jgi:hypothetical protein
MASRRGRGFLAVAEQSANGMELEHTFIEVWRQVMVENVLSVKLGEEHFPVRRTAKRGLRQVDFRFDGKEIRGLEQNPDTKSRWATMARSGSKVMQFLIPNPCTQCHADKSTAWATDAIRRWPEYFPWRIQ